MRESSEFRVLEADLRDARLPRATVGLRRPRDPDHRLPPLPPPRRADAGPLIVPENRVTYEATTAAVAERVVRAQGEDDVPADADPIETARALLAAQQGIVFMGRTGLDTTTLTATAHSLAAQLLPDA
jgi:hypothetical protein